MKIIIIFFIIIFFFNYTFSTNVNNKCIHEALNWEKISIEWNNYTENPTENSARNLIKFFPKNIIVSAAEVKAHRSIIDNIYNNLDILERKILTGSSASVEIAIRLYAIADGVFAEDLALILGLYLNKNIERFLEIISNYPLLNDLLLESFLVSVKPEILGDGVAIIKELEYRRKIIENVQKKSLQKLKDKCLFLIDKNLKELKAPSE